MSNVTFTSKAYSSKSNARRAAKTAHAAELGNNAINFNQLEDGTWNYQVVEVEAVEVVEEVVAAEVVEEEEVEAVEEVDEVVEEVEVKNKTVGVCSDKKEKSEVKSPCSLVWEIAEEQRDLSVVKGTKLSRKAVIEKCVQAGVAYNTARTQYQLWHQSRMGAK